MSDPRRLLRPIVVGLLATGLLSMASALAWADDESIIIDFVRHGESIDNNAGIIDTTPPGTALDPTGEGQATDVATAIQHDFGTNIAGVFDSQELRTQETAAPLITELMTSGIIDTTPPGTALDPTGEGQATDVATAIQHEFGTNIAGVFDSQELRTQETAAPLITELMASGDNPVLKTFDGLNEIPGSTRFLPAPSRATRRPALRASCTYSGHFPGRSGMSWCRMWAIPA